VRRQAPVRGVAADGREQLARQPRQQGRAAEPGLLRQVVEDVAADGALAIGLRDGAVRPVIDPGLRGVAVAALGEVLDELAQPAGDQAAPPAEDAPPSSPARLPSAPGLSGRPDEPADGPRQAERAAPAGAA
jgi:hypothetical protein